MGIHLTEFHNAVGRSIQERFDWLNSVSSYPEINTELTAPCAFFAVNDWFKADNQPMNGQLSIDLDCECLVVFGVADEAHQLSVRNAAMALCLAVEGERWGLPVHPARLTGAQPDAFSPELDAYVVWRIQWKQVVEVGDDAFDGEAFLPVRVMVGQSPLVGEGNEPYYTEVANESSVSSE